MRCPRPPVIVMLAGLKPACSHRVAAVPMRAPTKFGTIARRGVGVAVGEGVAVGVGVGVGAGVFVAVGVGLAAGVGVGLGLLPVNG